MNPAIDGKRILVTGATGSFGQQFIRRILRDYQPAKVAIYSRGEVRQAEFQAALASEFPSAPVRFWIGDIRDYGRLYGACAEIDTVVHAAALKRVEKCEADPEEAIKTNVWGAVNLMHAALRTKVERVLSLSTDKSAAPVLVYGATKLLMERLMVAANVYRGARAFPIFSCTRYGNVWASQGSVIPTWKACRDRGEPLPITNPASTRFYMTLDDSVDLVLLALEKMEGGEVFIPKLPAYRLGDLAEAFGGRFVPLTGRGPEKLAEALIGEDEAVMARDCGDYYTLGGRGTPVAEGFVYRSDQAGLLTVDQLRALL